MAHPVTCIYCKSRFDRDVIPFRQVNNLRYAHVECFEKAQNEMTEEDKQKQQLEAYLKQLFNTTYINAKIRKQIFTYKQEYGFTEGGILQTLIYWFDIKGNDIQKANNGIGIVPYVYKDAEKYYKEVQAANIKNENKSYNPNVEEVHIPIPQRNIRKKVLFSFLDKEVENYE